MFKWEVLPCASERRDVEGKNELFYPDSTLLHWVVIHVLGSQTICSSLMGILLRRVSLICYFCLRSGQRDRNLLTLFSACIYIVLFSAYTDYMFISEGDLMPTVFLSEE